MNRIKEVKKKLLDKLGREVPDACAGCHYREIDGKTVCEVCSYGDLPELIFLDGLKVCPHDEAFCLSLATKIYQLFPQPLDDKELREKLAIKLVGYSPHRHHRWGKMPKSIQRVYLDRADQIRALLQQRVEEAIKQDRERILGKDRPRIVCLCGSTRFVDAFNDWRKKLTLEGCIVLSIELVTTQSVKEDPQHSNHKVKQMLDELHLRKIDLADEVMILNVGGYIGNSTRAELEYAKSKGKSIKYLEALSGKRGEKVKLLKVIIVAALILAIGIVGGLKTADYYLEAQEEVMPSNNYQSSG